MGKVTVMGSFIYDVTAYVPRYPVDGETVLGYEIKTGPAAKAPTRPLRRPSAARTRL